MKEQLDRLERKMDSMGDDITAIKVTLGRNTESLIHHVARTDALETRVEQVDTALKMAKGVRWVLVAGAGVAGFIATSVEIWRAFRGQ